jgi:phosphate transport system substrate-binding protein
MKKKIIIFLIFFLLFLDVIIAQNKIVVGGTGACQDLLRALARDFMSNNSGTVDVPKSIGSSGGIKAMAKGSIDIGRVARKLKDSEKGYNLTYKEFALSPIVFGTKSDVGVTNLSSSDICKIYSGEIKNWKELGGKDLKIYVIGREEGDSSLSEINKSLNGFKNVKFTSNMIMALKDQEMIEKIKGKTGTIGYGTLSNFKYNKLKVFSIDKVSPTITNVQKNRYKIYSTFAFVYKNLTGLSKQFVDYVFSSKGKKVITSNYCAAKK